MHRERREEEIFLIEESYETIDQIEERFDCAARDTDLFKANLNLSGFVSIRNGCKYFGTCKYELQQSFQDKIGNSRAALVA